MTEPCDLSAVEARRLIGIKQLSPVELLESCLERIGRVDGALNALRFTVSGILSTGNPMVDNLGMFTSLETADRLLNAKGRLTHVAVRLESREDTADWAARAEAELQGLDARTWQEESAALMDSQKMRQTMFDVMGLAMMLMAATGIANIWSERLIAARLEAVRLNAARTKAARLKAVMGLPES